MRVADEPRPAPTAILSDISIALNDAFRSWNKVLSLVSEHARIAKMRSEKTYIP
jgi:hypothetical protein